jgi:hypothetical protein
MSLGLLLTIVAAVVALAWGVWMGLPGRYSQSVEDLEKAIESGGGTRRTTRKIFTPLAWLTRNPTGESARRSRRFKLGSPKDR